MRMRTPKNSQRPLLLVIDEEWLGNPPSYCAICRENPAGVGGYYCLGYSWAVVGRGKLQVSTELEQVSHVVAYDL